MRKFQPSLPLTICTLLGLAVLISLGTWQARKIGPKDEAIAAIKKGLSENYEPLPSVSDPAEADFKRVLASLYFKDVAPLKLVSTNQKGKPGYHLYLPANSNKGIVFVNLGWVPLETKIFPKLLQGQSLRVEGILRRSATPGMMQVSNDLKSDIWYLADIDQMAAYYGFHPDTVYPLRLFADPWAGDGALPVGGQLKVSLVNKHKEYAFTWFGIACALLGVYVAFGLQRGSERATK